MMPAWFAAAAALGACLAVDGDRILMKDLALREPSFSVLDPNEAAGYSPGAGARRIFGKTELERLAAAHGLTSAGAAICFERAVEPLTADRVLSALKASLNVAGAQIKLLDFTRQPAPRGELEFPRSGLGGPSATPPGLTATWRGKLTYAGGRSLPVWAKVELSVRRACVVAGAGLAAGKAIRADQLKLETCEQFPFGESSVQNPAEVIGRAPRRCVRRGEAILPTMLAQFREVERGDKVSVIVTSGKAQVRFDALAESGGHARELVLVRNPVNGRRFRARVEGKGKVVVDANPGGNSEEAAAVDNFDTGGPGAGKREKGEASQDIAHR